MNSNLYDIFTSKTGKLVRIKFKDTNYEIRFRTPAKWFRQQLRTINTTPTEIRKIFDAYNEGMNLDPGGVRFQEVEKRAGVKITDEAVIDLGIKKNFDYIVDGLTKLAKKGVNLRQEPYQFGNVFDPIYKTTPSKRIYKTIDKTLNIDTYVKDELLGFASKTFNTIQYVSQVNYIRKKLGYNTLPVKDTTYVIYLMNYFDNHYPNVSDYGLNAFILAKGLTYNLANEINNTVEKGLNTSTIESRIYRILHKATISKDGNVSQSLDENIRNTDNGNWESAGYVEGDRNENVFEEMDLVRGWLIYGNPVRG